MKKMFLAICLLAALGLTSCGKKDEKKEMNALDMGDETAQKMAQGKEIPVYQSDEEKFFDFDEGEAKEFAFVTEDGKKKGATVAENEAFDDEWEEEDLALAWEDEDEDKDYNFKVINFDLNKNNIRDDQKVALKENVALAAEAAKSGKKLIVAGHCCSLGSASYNMSLSEKRADAIRNEMVKGGVSEDQIAVLGCGAEHQIVLSDSSDRVERIKELGPNRRAEISIN